MSQILAVLAALVPVAAALWVAIRALLRDTALRRERAFRSELHDQHLEWLAECREAAGKAPNNPVSGAPGFGSYYDECQKRVSARVDARLHSRGYAPTPTYKEQHIEATAPDRAFSRAERQDQWVLIWAGIAGIVLLALSLVTS